MAGFYEHDNESSVP